MAPSGTDSPGPDTALSAELAAELAQLHTLLAADDLQAQALFQRLLPHLQAVLPAGLEVVAQAMDQFAFDQALLRLQAWCAQAGLAPADTGSAEAVVSPESSR